MRNLRAATDRRERLVNRNNRLSAARHVHCPVTCEGVFAEGKKNCILCIITIIVQWSDVLLVRSGSDTNTRPDVVELKIQTDIQPNRFVYSGKNNRLRVPVAVVLYSTGLLSYLYETHAPYNIYLYNML